MTYYKAALRRAQGVDHSDYLDGIYCHGEDEAAARAHAEQQHPGFSCQKLEASHIAIVASTQALASQWLGKIIACCQPSITAGLAHFGSINLHTLSFSESLADVYFDEVHVVSTEALTSEQLAPFRSRSKLLCLHTLPSHQHQYTLQQRVFNWNSESDFTAFLGHILSAQEGSIFPASLAKTANSCGPFRLIHSHEANADCALDCLLDKVSAPVNGKHNGILLIMEGHRLTLGEYASVCLALEEHFSEECELTVTVISHSATKDGYKLWLLLDSPRTDSPTESN